VATSANQIVASSVSGALVQWRRGNIDFRMGLVLTVGGVVGALAGVLLVSLLSKAGQADLFIALSYVTFLGVIGGLMLIESLRAIQRTRAGKPATPRKPGQHNWIHGLPLKMRFHRSRLYISAIPPLVLGLIIVPAMIYLLRVPTHIVIGTSLFQIVFVTAIVTVLYATMNHSLDAVLAFILVVGGVIGGQFGANAGQRLKGEQLRLLLALMVLAVALRLLIGLVMQPAEVFSLASVKVGA
jgi:uncharacterized membrane protein YfcA